MKPVFSGSLTTKAVKQCIKGALLLHETDALILQHVKCKQRARLDLLLILLLMPERNYAESAQIEMHYAVLTDN